MSSRGIAPEPNWSRSGARLPSNRAIQITRAAARHSAQRFTNGRKSTAASKVIPDVVGISTRYNSMRNGRAGSLEWRPRGGVCRRSRAYGKELRPRISGRIEARRFLWMPRAHSPLQIPGRLETLPVDEAAENSQRCLVVSWMFPLGEAC